MRNPRFTPAVALAALVLGCLWTGCASRDKYELAKGEVAAAPRLDFQAVEPTAELVVETVIVCKGPGSWKHDARWDEYVVQVTNRTQQLLRIESAVLVDFKWEVQAAGWDPWQLENRSNANWQKYRNEGVQLKAGAGTEKLTKASGRVAATDAAMHSVGESTAATPLHDVVPAEFVHDGLAEPTVNGSNKDTIAREFARRRIFLPVTMPPGGSVRGSLFFPMTPGPQRLVLNARYGETPVTLTLELQPLAALHLAPPGDSGEMSIDRVWSWMQKTWTQAFGPSETAKAAK